MPYFLRGSGDKWCVVKGTKDSPGKEMHCYSGSGARSKARTYLATLYAKVDDASDNKDLISAISLILSRNKSLRVPYMGHIESFKEISGDADQDRWVSVSSHDIWDLQEQRMTTDAMDWDIARAYSTKSFPELRMFHVRGFKLGKCDSMARMDRRAVDQGSWLKTPFPQAVKDLVINNDGKWKTSRGFYTVQASGQCPQCGSGLNVGLINFITGVTCKDCSTFIPKAGMLDRLQYLKTMTYDISVTDVPVVPTTAIAAYSLSTNMEINNGKSD